MNQKHYLPMLAFCLLGGGCNSTKEMPLTAGIQVANLDTTALPGTDFYQFACGGWIKNNPLTNEYSRFGSFDYLAENNRKQLNELITGLATTKHEAGSVAQKVGDLYNVAMDSVKLNREGFTPVKEDLNELATIRDKNGISTVIAQLHRLGVTPFFAIYVAADQMNSAMNMVQTYQSGLGMPERDYYFAQDEHTRNIREKYTRHIINMFRLAGFDEDAAKAAEKAVMDIETRLAKAARSSVELRDPYTNYNKKTIDELKKDFAQFDWDSYFTAVGLTDLKEINIGQPAGIKESITIINTVPIADLNAYLQWRLISESASCLSDEFVNEQFDFYDKTLSGKQELQPRWKRAVSTLSGILGEAVGQMYVEKYFPAAAKERMVVLVGNLQTSLGERIRNLSWMSDETKEKALEKLATFHVKIGYPDKWKDYTPLEIRDDSFWANMKRASVFEFNKMMADAGKPVDKDKWLMTPQTVNAYYNPTTNEICFPAGILQYPFFDMNADDAFNYGAIGVVIGHEMTHGFDDKGSQYDKDGNLKNWWTEQDAENFKTRADVMVNLFNKIEVEPGVFANGELTLGENIADYGGIQISYQAFKNATAANPLEEKLGFTPEQRFFLAYANVWAGNIRPEEKLRLTKIDPHSLGRWRVNAQLPQIDAWYEAFNITENNPMFVPATARVSIW